MLLCDCEYIRLFIEESCLEADILRYNMCYARVREGAGCTCVNEGLEV